jgi:hypothetical protein
MKKVPKYLSLGLLIVFSSTAFAVMDGQVDNSTDAYGLYYQITGGKFVNGQTYTGNNASGGVFRYIHDDPTDTTYPDAYQQWKRDDWFDENAGLALTMKNSGSIVYNNNGIEDDTHGGYYDDTQTSIAGLYMSYAMSNNDDWIYCGYFKLSEETTVDTIIGYFDGTGYYGNFDPDNPVVGYRMNVWNCVMDGSYPMPSNDTFTGDVFSSDTTAGTFSWSDTGVARHYSGWGEGVTDPIYRLEYTLDTPLVLPAGEYFFSHDATIPEPATISVLALGGLLFRRKK